MVPRSALEQRRHTEHIVEVAGQTGAVIAEHRVPGVREFTWSVPSNTAVVRHAPVTKTEDLRVLPAYEAWHAAVIDREMRRLAWVLLIAALSVAFTWVVMMRYAFPRGRPSRGPSLARWGPMGPVLMWRLSGVAGSADHGRDDTCAQGGVLLSIQIVRETRSLPVVGHETRW